MTGRPPLTFTIILLAALLLAACADSPDAGPTAELATVAPTARPIEPTKTPELAAADLNPPTFSAAQLQEDFRILRTTLEEVHPGLYAYVAKDERDAQFAAAEARLDREMTGDAFYRLVAPLVADIHDSHTWVWPAPDASFYASPEASFLPLTLMFFDGRAFVDAVAGGGTGALGRGQELLAVNGQDMAAITARLLPYVPHDGLNDSGRYHNLGLTFPLFYGYAFEPTLSYRLEVRDPLSGATSGVDLPGIDPAALAAFMNEVRPGDASPELDLSRGAGIAVMTIPSFDRPGLADFYEQAFGQLKDEAVQDLVIDLRGNGGGDGGGDRLLYAYLAAGPFRYFDHLALVFDRPPTYVAHTNKPESDWLAILDSVERQADGTRRLPHWYGLDEVQQPSPDAFEGNVYILIDGGCASATAEFAAVAHDRGRAVFIGQETGGTYWGNHSGQMPVLTLPNTGISVIVPLYRFVMDVSGPAYGRGVPPDYPVTPTPAEAAGGVDAELAFALELIRQGR